jgi:hypothetical protein
MARERANHTLPTSALIEEAYLRLVDGDRVSWQGRNHFFAVCRTPTASYTHKFCPFAELLDAGRRCAANHFRSG